jgi:hypothetical protein
MARANPRTTILASTVFALALASSMSACSGGDDSSSDDGSSAAGTTTGADTGATSAGNTSAASSTTGSASNTTGASSTASTGAGGTTGSGDSTTGTDGGGALPDEMCSGIGNGDACTTPGTCSGRVCGLADTGTRDCTCTTTWDCSSCAWSDPIPEVARAPTEPLAACDAAIADEVPCDTRGDRCQQSDEVCACWLEDEGVLVWDCDSAPSFWED